MIDTCHYCGYQYHPMPVFILKHTGDDVRKHWTGEPGDEFERPHRIHVCNLRVIFDDDGKFVRLETDRRECWDKALEDGYVFRRDLTPTR